MSRVREIPSDDEIMAAVAQLGPGADASAVLQALVGLGHPPRKAQLAIQRATDRGRIVVGRDWILSVGQPLEVAA